MSSYSPDERTPPRQSVDSQEAGPASGSDRLITPARIGEFIGFEQCARYFKHSVDDVTRSVHFDARELKEAFQPLNILLTKAGEEFETAICEELAADSRQLIDCDRPDEDRFVDDHGPLLEAVATAQEAAPEPDSPTILYQASLKGPIGDWAVAGDADLILVWSTDEGVTVRVIDVKSAQEEKSYHQIQAATYVDLVRGLLDDTDGLDEDDATCEGGIVTRGDTLTPPTPEDIPLFDVDSRIIDVRRLLAADGPLAEMILDQCAIKQFHKLDGMDEQWADEFGLNHPQMRFVQDATPGSEAHGYSQALLGVNGEWHGIEVRALERERAAIEGEVDFGSNSAAEGTTAAEDPETQQPAIDAATDEPPLEADDD
jgi:hypothetical protein